MSVYYGLSLEGVAACCSGGCLSMTGESVLSQSQWKTDGMRRVSDIKALGCFYCFCFQDPRRMALVRFVVYDNLCYLCHLWGSRHTRAAWIIFVRFVRFVVKHKSPPHGKHPSWSINATPHALSCKQNIKQTAVSMNFTVQCFAVLHDNCNFACSEASARQ